MELKICHLYPEALNLAGEGGNIICLLSRLKRRGIDTQLVEMRAGDNLDLTEFDLFFAGGGQDFKHDIILKDLEQGRAASIRSAVEDEKVFLTICGGYQMMGQYFKTCDGSQIDFIGAINVHTIDKGERMVGDCMFNCTQESGDCTIVGFENHSGKTFLGENVEPLGYVVKGYGNNGEDKTDGARYKNVFASYCQGTVLPKNPVFADLIISTALNRKYPDSHIELMPLDDMLEKNAHDYMVKRLS